MKSEQRYFLDVRIKSKIAVITQNRQKSLIFIVVPSRESN